MSVATQNKFALLNDDEAGIAAPTTKAGGQTGAAQPTPAPRTNTRGRGAQQNTQSRSGRYYKRGGAPTATETTNVDESSTSPAVTGARFDRTEGRNDRGRGRGRGRGGRGGGDRPPRGRYHDRDSQTGKVDTEKAVNQGWGADTGAAELGAELQGAADARAEGVADGGVTGDTSGWDAPAPDASGWDAPAPAEGAAGDTEAGKEGAAEGEGRRKRREEEEEEDNTLTLDQYLAKKRAEEQAALPKLEGTRSIENGEWKGATQLLKEESEEVYFAGKSKASAPKAKAKKDEKVYIPIDLPPQQREFRGRGGRGGRGGDRGGRGRGDRGGGRGGRRGESWGDRANGRGGAQGNVDVDDQSAFPSLS